MTGLLGNLWDNRESVVGGLFNMFSNKKESKLGDDFKYSLLARNFIPDIKEGADELKTIIDNPRVALKSALELGGGAIGKLTPDFIDQGLLKIAPNNLITSENTSQMASDAYEDIKKNLGSLDAVKKTIQDNPFDTLLAASGIGAVANQVRKASTPTIKKTLAKAEENGLMDEIRKVGSAPVGLSIKDVSYGGTHRPPSFDGGAPGHNVTGDIYPDDIYSDKAVRYYGTGGVNDQEAINIIQKMKGNPEMDVIIYRAVPKDIKKIGINNGDWVTTIKSYAEDHAYTGYGAMGNESGKVISKTVKAKDIYTNGDSIMEWGYAPRMGLL